MDSEQTTLFRRAAIHGSSPRVRYYRDIHLPRDLRRYVALLLGLVCVSLGFLSHANYAEKISVRGRLTDGTTDLFANTTGSIDALHVAVGDSVRSGDVLATISTSRASGMDRDDQLRLGRLVIDERLQIAALIATAYLSRQSVANATAKSIASLQLERRLLDQQRELLQSESQRQQNRMSRSRKLLERGVLAPADIDTVLKALNQATTSLLDNELQLARIDRSVSSIQHEDKADVHRLTEKVAQLTLELLATDRRLHEFRSFERQQVIAAFDGTVSQLMVGVNETVAAETPLMSVRPKDRALKVELFLTGRALEVAKPGVVVRLRYDAYPYRKYGLFDAVITELNDTAAPSGSNSAVIFHALASIDIPSDANTHSLVLRDQMTLSADLIGEKRRFIQWLFGPLVGIWKRSAS